MYFKRFRVSGFKSFAEPIEVDILPGLTGVVGPNGCGKSNLVESLRWVMGETSSKSMRGGSMEDVIFAGTSLRASREIAEVSVVLDNQSHEAPEPYSENDEIEITRNIQRDAGSHYQVNGEEVRARDVNLFFSDLLGGAHSSALVSQGRIDQIILSKPKEKKRILEEAAGITGLGARRHEAELKLNRAQSNLDKVLELIKQTESRLRHLQKQAVQAERYQSISKEMNRNEAIKLYLRWQQNQQKLEIEQQKNSSADGAVIENTKAAASALSDEQGAESKLTLVREAANETASAFERLEGERALLASEIQKIEEKITTLKRTEQELIDDKARTEKMLADSNKQTEILGNESDNLTADSANDQKKLAETGEKLTQAQKALEIAEDKAQTATEKNSSWQAQIISLRQQLEGAQKRLARADEEEKEITIELEVFSAFDDESQEVLQFKQNADSAYQASRECEEKLQEIEKSKKNAEQVERASLDYLTEMRSEANQHLAEVFAMEKLFADIGNHPGKAVIDLIKSSWFSGRNLEKAMAAALGDDLMASLETGSASFWKDNGKKERVGFFFRRNSDNALPALPSGCQPLSKFIRKPPVLRARLSQTGLVDADKGEILQKKLKPGQRLVSREGHLWRWDGFCADPRIAQATQNRLAQWKTFSEMEELAQKAKLSQTDAEAKLAKARKDLADISAEVENCKSLLAQANEEAEKKRDAWQEAAAKISTASAKKAALDEAARRLRDERSDGQKMVEENVASLELAENNGQTKNEESAARVVALLAREEVSKSKEAQNLVLQNISKRKQRIEEIAQNRLAAEKNLSQLTEQVSVLSQRQKNTQIELTNLAELPASLNEKMIALIKQLEDTQKSRDETAQNFKQADEAYQELRNSTKQLENALSTARESYARQKAVCEAASEALLERSKEIEAKFNLKPQQVIEWAELSEPNLPLPSLREIDQVLERLERERTRIGAPNLQAEAERAEMIEGYENMKSETDDLQKAIKELRRGIATLNSEGRERLEEAFEIVNKNFKELFKLLFGGGSARLNLVGNAIDEGTVGVDKDIDILEAGLDIVARPPGKSIQNMSLLSGGEKTLTALALLFAAFKAHPSPICVLDEVDAPLDDKNVERFCNLVAEIARSEKTRFLVVTHHALTLSKMDRLYGVTMEEEGVSRIVSVDLGEAKKLRDTPQAAE